MSAATAASCLSFSGEAALPYASNEVNRGLRLVDFCTGILAQLENDDTRHLWYSIMARACGEGALETGALEMGALETGARASRRRVREHARRVARPRER